MLLTAVLPDIATVLVCTSRLFLFYCPMDKSSNTAAQAAKEVNTSVQESDPLEEMLDRTGCKQRHYSLQECMYEHKDWRKCKDLVTALRDCMLHYEQNKMNTSSQSD